ncbi:VOC family protein [Jannaschia sp. W003]|uniref:VOC family protein n=1 Tax=Jannaschia sp. W003 TaxID=2867012 RepID=UPI0021A8BAED|nr:VOC family protein [Jannaschia sp. W003]UWQ20634.1 VOC family protein [Jannaschia sp. W003]
MPSLDHIAVAAATTEEGAVHLAASLGLPPGPGGRHAVMGTHNRLLGLEDGLYVEAIAPDPEAAPPGRARWFALDDFEGQPRLSNWVLRCEDLELVVAANPDAGRILALERGPFRWRMAVPDDGRLPFGGCFPALMQWDTAPPALPSSGLRLERLILRHPEADALRTRLGALVSDPRITVEPGPAAALAARFATPDGPRDLL